MRSVSFGSKRLLTELFGCGMHSVGIDAAWFVETSLKNYSIPPLIEYPLIEYSNILNTEVVHGLGSMPKII